MLNEVNEESSGRFVDIYNSPKQKKPLSDHEESQIHSQEKQLQGIPQRPALWEPQAANTVHGNHRRFSTNTSNVDPLGLIRVLHLEPLSYDLGGSGWHMGSLAT